MYYKEKFGNLFELGEKYTYVQCISMDLKMGAGIAVQFNRHFNVKSKLLVYTRMAMIELVALSVIMY